MDIAESLYSGPPPAALEAEEAVLGALLSLPKESQVILNELRSEHFYKPAHRKIYDAITDLIMDGKEVDLVTIEGELKDRKELESIGGMGFITNLSRSAGFNYAQYCERIIKCYIQRKSIEIIRQGIKELGNSMNDPEDELEKIQARLFELTNNTESTHAVKIGDMLHDALFDYEEKQEQDDGITGIPSGLDVDNLTGGYHGGEFTVVGARPSMGKTAYVLTTALNAAAMYDHNVLVFSLEMPKLSLVQRFLAMDARINSDYARKGRLSKDEFKKMIRSAEETLNEAGIYIDDTPGLTPIQLRAKTRRAIDQHGINMVIVDYLQLMNDPDNKGMGKTHEMTEISNQIQEQCRYFNVPFIALSQLSRAVEQRGGDKRPQMSDLRDTGAIEQAANVVQLLYRPEYYGIDTNPEGESTDGIAEVIVGKNRNGPVGTIRLYFNKESVRFDNLSKSVDPNNEKFMNREFNDDAPF